MADSPALDHALMMDYHCHCDFSIDAVGTVEEYCEAALARGLVEICFTTHYDANPSNDQRVNRIRVNGEERPTTPDNLAPYVEAVHAAADKYLPLGLTVRLGLEFGWYPGCEEEVLRLKERYPFEYMLCGIHELDNLCFCCRRQFRECFSRYLLPEMMEAYFTEVMTAARTGLFDTIAHLDYYKKYGLEYYGEEVLEAHEPFLPEVFRALVESNTSLELNTAAVRKGLDSYFPSLSIVHAARRAGVEVFYLGSDAHRPEEVGAEFDLVAPLVGHTMTHCDE